MQRLVIALLIAVFAAATALADDAQQEREALAGTWRLTALMIDGDDVPADKMPSITVTFNADGTADATHSMAGELSTTYTLNTDSSPKQIDLVHTAGSLAGASQYGVYELDGDTLLMSATDPGAEESARPGDFSSDLLTFVRD
ncbi:MAG: TIGR03067 domain-containing protein [Planctomycetota bacterium]